MKNEEAEGEDAFRIAHPNGLISEENGAASCGDTLEMLNYALADYLNRFGNNINCLLIFLGIQIECFFCQIY